MRLEPAPFLYGQLLDSVRASEWRHLVLWSGRGLGKTTFLRYYERSIQQDRLANEFKAAPTLIRGRSLSAADAILEWARHRQGIVLIDDLDQVSSKEARTAIRDLMEADGDWRVMASSRNPDAIELTAQWSRTLERIRLDPWQGDWREVSKKAVQDCAECALARLEGVKGSLDSVVVAAWQEAIVAVTGGHPSLVGSACRHFSMLLRRRGESHLSPGEFSLLEASEASLETRVCVYLEDFLVDKELPIFLSIIRDVERRPQLFEYLFELSQEPVSIDDPFIRKELRDTGLLYMDHDRGKLVVPGSLIRHWIRHFAESSSAAAQAAQTAPTVSEESKLSSSFITLEVLGDSPYDGLLRCVSDTNESVDIPVSGAPWRVLRCLSGAKGNPVPVPQLAKEANLGTVPATRSAIQRLQQLLKRNGLVNVVDNVRGLGYRLGSFPVLSHGAAWGKPVS